MKVLVFKNIKNKRWTIWDITRTKHLGYRKKLQMNNCSFIVDESKRKKVISTGKRFPHAWIIGEISAEDFIAKKEVNYNPFINNSFVSKTKPVLRAKKVKLLNNGKVFI